MKKSLGFFYEICGFCEGFQLKIKKLYAILIPKIYI
jgi:hypothetical protein